MHGFSPKRCAAHTIKIYSANVLASEKREVFTVVTKYAGGFIFKHLNTVNSFGERLKFWRERKGLTQEQLAERCKSSEQVIRSYEKNRNKPGSEMITRLCDALLVNPDYLMQDNLSFNPYEDRNETFNDIAKLPPSDYQLVKGFVENLKNQGVKK